MLRARAPAAITAAHVLRAAPHNGKAGSNVSRMALFHCKRNLGEPAFSHRDRYRING